MKRTAFNIIALDAIQECIKANKDTIINTIIPYFECGHLCETNENKCCWCRKGNNALPDTTIFCEICNNKPSVFKNLDSRCYTESVRTESVRTESVRTRVDTSELKNNYTYTLYCFKCREVLPTNGGVIFSTSGKILCEQCKVKHIKLNLDSDCEDFEGNILCFICDTNIPSNKPLIYQKKYLEKVYITFCKSSCREKYKKYYIGGRENYTDEGRSNDNDYE